jgi:hypothetical protein
MAHELPSRTRRLHLCPFRCETMDSWTDCNRSAWSNGSTITSDSITHLLLTTVALVTPRVAVSWSSVFMSAVQWMIFAAGIAGNLLVLSVLIWRRSANQRVTQLFVGLMSATDIGLLLTGGWVQAVLYVTETWTLGRYSCKLQNGFLIVHVNTSAWTLVALTVDRWAFRLTK